MENNKAKPGMPRDDKYTIAVGDSTYCKSWRNREVTWKQLTGKLSRVIVTPETVEEYKAFNQDQKQKAKDHGGFVGGSLIEDLGRRRKDNILNRCLITLDIEASDVGPDLSMEDVNQFSSRIKHKAVLYSTHSHRPDRPRLRLVVPLPAPVPARNYEIIARWYAKWLGILQWVDVTSLRPTQLMYWPSHPSNGEYLFRVHEGPVIQWKDFLPADWDTAVMPTNPWETGAQFSNGKKADPRDRDDWVGAFCRTYSVEDTIRYFLYDIYEECSPGRYRLIGSESQPGLIVNEPFAVSYHGTDPCNTGGAVSAFDLVCNHCFDGDFSETVSWMAKELIEVREERYSYNYY